MTKFVYQAGQWVGPWRYELIDARTASVNENEALRAELDRARMDLSETLERKTVIGQILTQTLGEKHAIRAQLTATTGAVIHMEVVTA